MTGGRKNQNRSSKEVAKKKGKTAGKPSEVGQRKVSQRGG